MKKKTKDGKFQSHLELQRCCSLTHQRLLRLNHRCGEARIPDESGSYTFAPQVKRLGA